MINNNTLLKLNKIGTGANIDLIESYCIDFKQANITSYNDMSNHKYKELVEILRELKPSSKYFSSTTSLEELDKSQFDVILNENKYSNSPIVYGIKSLELDDYKKIIDNKENKVCDIFAYFNVRGLKIIVSYMEGHLYRIYCVDGQYKYLDLTELLGDKVPNYIEELSKVEYCELRGVVTLLFDSQEIKDRYIDLECAVNHCIRTKTNLDRLQFIFHSIIYNKDSLNRWEQIDWLVNNKFYVMHQALIRNVSSEDLQKALYELRKYFDNMDCTDEIYYWYKGVHVCDNDMDSELDFIYNFTDCDEEVEYESNLKGIITYNRDGVLVVRLNIVRTVCNEEVVIDYIDVDDANILRDNDIKVGDKVRFRIIERNPVLV